MKRPKVSIIVPVYNVEQYLPQCMDSLLNQTLRDVEIILVDDESPDRCPQLCDEYARQEARVQVVHKKNEGLGMACNSGIEVATGEYIVFCDSDDWVDTDMYNTMYDWAKEKDADVVFTGYKKVDNKGVCHGLSIAEKNVVITGEDEISNLILDIIASRPNDSVEHHIPMSAKTTLYKRELIEKYTLRFKSERQLISEDLIWNCDVLAHSCKVVVKAQAFYNYRDNSSSLSCRIRKDRFPFFIILYKEILQRYATICPIEKLQERADRLIIGESRHYIRVLSNSTLPQTEVIGIIKSICNNDIWTKVRERYPVQQMPMKYRIPYELMQRKHYYLLYLMCKVI